MPLTEFLTAIEQIPAIDALRKSTLVYPLVNALHVVGVALLFGSIVPLDLRLAGWSRAAGPVDGVARLLLPVAITGLALAVCAGLLLFATDAGAYAASWLFRIKMLLLLLAVGNALALRRIDWRSPGTLPRAAAIAGLLSILLWLGVILLGRLVGYF